MEPCIYEDVRDIDFSIDELPDRERENRVFMVEPTYFDVTYEINEFMDKEHEVDRAKGWAQWNEVKDAYEELGFTVHVADGEEALPDMVFSANHGMPYEKDGRNGIVLSNMTHAERDGEVDALEGWCREHGYDRFHLKDGYRFEGTGDAIWHPGKELLWGGHGDRSDREVYDVFLRQDIVDAPIITLEPDPEWYHLDTCFAPLNQYTALAYRKAFTDNDWDKIEKMFNTVIEVPEDEARTGLAANAHSPDDRTVIMNAGNPVTQSRLEDAGFTVKSENTGEFGKSGGSVYCMKLMIPE